jgi:hypothetical protein
MSDTHMPARLAALPETLWEVFRDVQFILHAGDVGELWVLDRLSQIAPTIAVHGNDETHDAQRELPYQQLITVAGRRILLTHSHFPDRAEEMRSRLIDAWPPKLDRWAGMAARAGASVVVLGHTHIPMAVHHGGVLVVNPGALASAGPVVRQRLKAVALLFIMREPALAPLVAHVDLASPGAVYTPQNDYTGGFQAVFNQYSESILEPGLRERWPEINQQVLTVLLAENSVHFEPLLTAIYAAAHPCWAGEKAHLTAEDLRAAIRGVDGLPASLLARAEAVLGG